MTDELTWTSARELRRLIAQREISPVDVVAACLARIDALEPTLHAFITVVGERALDDAQRAEAAVQRGDSLGPLHGVPVALKDEAWTEDIPSTDGSLLFKRFVPSRDGTVTERLRRAGAIVIGKTNMPEFAAWPRSKSRLAGESVNPWDITRISGASSGGSAAAVAAGMVPLAIGSDGGGSTRIPSAFCGVFGLFPTPGRVPSYGSFSYSTEGSLGPIGRNVADLAVLQQVIAGPDPRDALAITEPAPDVVSALDSGRNALRIAWSPDFGRIPVDPRIAATGRAALERTAAAGVVVEEIATRFEHPWGDGSLLADLQAAVMAGSWNLDDTDLDIPDTSLEQEWMWAVFAGPVPLTATPEFRALCTRYRHLLTPPSQLTYQAAAPADARPAPVPDTEALKSAMHAVFATHDVLCSPTMATVAPVAPDGWATPYADAYMGTNFTFIANSTRCPAASVPCGLVDGMPVGLQIIGPPGDEATVLRACRAVETASPAPPRPDPIA
jgi:Asp-tRNA(Asn)/Glu-tRNA(Gln) amidotransferase A subunit family amidase